MLRLLLPRPPREDEENDDNNNNNRFSFCLAFFVSQKRITF